MSDVLPWQTKRNTPCDVALRYASMGWAVFPVHSRRDNGLCSCGNMSCSNIGKHPRTQHGVTDATTNTATIRHWWNQWPDAHVAVATGKASGWFAVDVDYKSEQGIDGNDAIRALEKKHGPLPDTVEQITPSGGRHILFRLPDGFSKRIKTRTNSLGQAVDIRGDGGYIVAWPSAGYEWEGSSDPMDGHRMAESPAWLLAMVVSEIKHNDGGDYTGIGTGYLDPKTTDELRDALQYIDPDESYDRWVGVGMALRSMDVGETAFIMWDEWSQRGAKYNAAEMGWKWRTFSSGGDLNKESIFYWASQRGWVNPLAGGGPGPEQPAPIWDAEPMAPKQKAPDDIPDAVLNPPGILGTIADYMTATAPRPQHIFSVSTAICMVATAAGRMYETPTGLRTNMYMLSIGQSGAGKDHPRKTLTRILHEAELFDLVGGEEIASGSAMTSMLLRSPACVSQIDEFGRFMAEAVASGKGSHKYSLLRKMMILFSSANSIVPGHELSTLGAKNPSEIERRDLHYPNMSLHMTTVLDELIPALTSADVFSGFLNRMLLLQSTGRRPKLRTDIHRTPTPDTIHDWIKRVRTPQGAGNLAGLSNEAAITVQMDGEARLLLNGFNDWAYEQECEHEGQGIDSLYSRALEHAAKLSLVAALSSEPDSPKIRGEHVQWGIEFVKYSISLMHTLATEHMADSAFRGVVQRCKQLVEAAGERGLTAYEIARRFAGFAALKPREQDEVLTALMRDGIVQNDNTGKPGKKRIAFVMPVESTI